MLENWLTPVSIHSETALQGHFAQQIQIYQDQLPDLRTAQVALLSIHANSGNAVREQLYQLQFHFSKLQIVDLGNIRKQNTAFFTQVIQELINGRIVPIILGENASEVLAQYQAYPSIRQLSNLVIIDEQIHCDVNDEKTEGNYLNPIVHGAQAGVFNLGLLGFQTHFVATPVLEHLQQLHFDTLRLGKMKADISSAEPFIRDADLLCVHLAALKHSAAPAQTNGFPTGLTIEEACQLTYYAGMSDKLSSIGFYGFAPAQEVETQTAKSLALLIWYFLDGFYRRKGDYPVSTAGLVEYIVHLKRYDYELTFWKSKRSSRWWLQVPMRTQQKHQRHKLIPCAYEDYLTASEGELPDRLWNAFRRFA
ncbi:MAG: arginase family protein [Bacteroidota bacterium]